MLWLIAVRNLLQQRRRTLLLGGALGGVTALLVLLLGLVNGIDRGMFESFTAVFSGHLNLEGFYKVTPGRSQAAVTGFPELLKLVREKVPEATEVVQRSRGWARVSSETYSMQLATLGVDIENDSRLRKAIHIKEGSFDSLREEDTILIFAAHADRFGAAVGDSLTITAPMITGQYNSVDVKVGAIAEDLGAMSTTLTFVPNATVRKLYGFTPDTTGALLVYLSDVSDVDEVHGRLRQVLAAAGHQVMEDDPRIYFQKTEKVNAEEWTGQKLDVTTYKASMSLFGWFSAILKGIAVTLVSILLFIISVGVMNTVWIAIRERTREIGTLRAIGMQRFTVLRMFLAEVVTLSVVATTLGALVGQLACLLISAIGIAVPPALRGLIMTETLVLSADLPTALLAVAVISFATTSVAVFPSFRAARMRPITAIHHIG